MFHAPLTMVYAASGEAQPCWSQEEYDARLAECFLAEKPEAVVEPAPEMIAETEPEPAKRGPGRPRKTQQQEA